MRARGRSGPHRMRLSDSHKGLWGRLPRCRCRHVDACSLSEMDGIGTRSNKSLTLSRRRTRTSRTVTRTSPCHLSRAYPASTHTRRPAVAALCPGQKNSKWLVLSSIFVLWFFYFFSEMSVQAGLSLNLFLSLSLYIFFSRNKDGGDAISSSFSGKLSHMCSSWDIPET